MEGTWDLDRLRQIVAENELERGRVEYKRELGNGHSTLEAVSALANTFGGVVLIGVDEQQPSGDSRLTGVAARERDRLVSFCWDQLTPPYSPEIVPVPLGRDDLYVHVVVVDPDRARRPVMLNRGNKVLVRLEGGNQAPDWYRLRELFAEPSGGAGEPGLRPPDTSPHRRPGETVDADLGVRGRLMLPGPRGAAGRVSESLRRTVLESLNSRDAPLTGTGSSVMDLVLQMCGGKAGGGTWVLGGAASTSRFMARWEARSSEGRRLADAGFQVMAAAESGRTVLRVSLDVLLTDSRRPAASSTGNSDHPAAGDAGPAPEETDQAEDPERTVPFIGLGALRGLMLDLTGTLWGSAVQALVAGITGQPLGPPALLDMAVFTVAEPDAVYGEADAPPLNHRIDFGRAVLIPGNTPGPSAYFGPVEPDQNFLLTSVRAEHVHRWLIQLGLNNGYDGIGAEVARWTGITDH
ncbi:MAG: AlbA family DNA-binding domain-containing protein [Streptosporangiaceae bacterium]